MSRRPTITIVLDGYSSLVSGHGSRDMVEGITGRPPVWSKARRGWVTQEHTARRVLALAESTHCDIVITGARNGHRRDQLRFLDRPSLAASGGSSGTTSETPEPANVSDRLW